MLRYALPALLLAAAPVAAQDWQLVWQDEFDVPGAPDANKWNYDIGGSGWGNQELQYYTDRTDNARVEDGKLIIEAKEEQFGGRDYTSARLVTRGTAAWQYGRFEARMKMPFGQGIWPAFWMLPTDSPYGGWPRGGEIDIMEYLGHDTDRTYGTLHYGGGAAGHLYTGTSYTLDSGTFADDFHTFAVEWSPNKFQWFVDGELFQTQINWSSGGGAYPAPFDHPFHFLFNLAVGGEWPGYPDATTTFPQFLEVDYVRVYQDASAYPVVQLDGPVDGSTAAAGSTVSLAATATDGGEIEEVEFSAGRRRDRHAHRRAVHGRRGRRGRWLLHAPGPRPRRRRLHERFGTGRLYRRRWLPGRHDVPVPDGARHHPRHHRGRALRPRRPRRGLQRLFRLRTTATASARTKASTRGRPATSAAART